MNSVSEVLPGVWMLHFPTPEDTIASKCVDLVPPLVAASKQGRLVVLAQMAPDQGTIDISMPTFWLDAFTKKGVKVSALGVITTVAGVRVAVKGFHLAMKTVGAAFEAQAFDDAAAAIAWAKTVVEPRLR